MRLNRTSICAWYRDGVHSGRHPLRSRAFTLIEMLVVIAIIGIVAAMSVPAIKNIQKADAVAAGTRQLLDDLGRARQFALSQRTTVYMVFVPPGFWNDPNFGANYTPEDWEAVTNIYDKQLVGYNFVSLRNVGDQPGLTHPKYLDKWRTLPEGIYINPQLNYDFSRARNVPITLFSPQSGASVKDVYRFEYTDIIPFPTAETDPSGTGGYVSLPYLAFDYQGQLISQFDEEVISLVRGKISHARDQNTKLPLPVMATYDETPPGNSTNAYNLIIVDRLTGRASVERP